MRPALALLAPYSMPLVFAASAAAVAIAAAPVLDRGGALAFGTLATAWLLLARAVVAGVLGYSLKRLRPRLLAVVVPSLVVDGVAVAAAGAIHPRLIPAALLGVVLGELFYAFAVAWTTRRAWYRLDQ